MRKALGNAVRKEFGKKLTNRLPQFHLLPGEHLYPGDRLYCWKKEAHLSFYIRLVVDPKGMRETFTLEIGWSRNDQPPVHQSINYRDDLGRDSAYFRLSSFWSSIDPWWELSHDASFENILGELQKTSETESGLLERIANDPDFKMRSHLAIGNDEPIEAIVPKIPAIIDDAVGKLQEFAIPFFEGFEKQ